MKTNHRPKRKAGGGLEGLKHGGERMIVIEKGVPMPHKANCVGFALMEVGESVFVPNKKSGQAQSLIRHLIPKGKRFSARNCEVDGVAGCRLWRVK